MSARPFEGLLVLDLSRVLAGPWCTMVLGDLGARIIKIESPAGDDTRTFGPPFLAGESVYYLGINRNKESVVVDFQRPEGAALLRHLAARADILVENFRPGTLERYGLDYASCTALNPRSIYASITGYGQNGPDRDRPGYDLVAQGEGGVMDLTGSPDGPPYKVGVSQADTVTGLWMVGGIATALYARERTGRGQRIDLALLDGQLSLLGFQGANYLLTGKIPGRTGNEHPMLTPYATFATADGWINVAVVTPKQWEAFCAVIELPELAVDSRFRTNPDRVAHRVELDVLIEPIFRTRSRDEWLERLAARDVPAGAVRNVAEALESTQSAARGMVIEVEHPTIGRMRQTGLPLKFSETPGAPSGPPPLHGGQSDQVLSELCGLSTEELADLKRRGVIAGK